MKRMTGTLLGQFSEASWLYEKEIQLLGAVDLNDGKILTTMEW